MTEHVNPNAIEDAERLTHEEFLKVRAEIGRVTPLIKKFSDLEQDGVFLNYQKRLLATTAVNSVTVVEKSRRTGATWALAADAVLTSSTDSSEGGMDTLYIGYNLDMAKEFIDTAGEWAKTFHKAAIETEEFIFVGKDEDGNDKDITAFRIKFASGNEIIALTSNPRSLRGRQGFVIIDEAAFHDDLDGLLKAAMALLMWGGKVCVISTHNGDENAYNKLIQEIRAGTKSFALVRFDIDDALKDGLYERICLRTKQEWSVEKEAQWREDLINDYGDDADEELFCVPTQGSGTFLTSTLIRDVQQEGIPVLVWAPPKDFVRLSDEHRLSVAQAWCEDNLLPLLEKLDQTQRHAMGADFGRVHDLTVYWPLAITRAMKKVTPFVVELRGVPFKEQEYIGKFIGERLPRLTGIAPDGRGLGAQTSEALFTHFGSATVTIVQLSQTWYMENMPKFKQEFEDKNIVIPKDDDHYSDLRLIKVKRGIAQIPSDERTLSKAQKNKTRHGDAAIAAALANFACEIDGLEYGYITANDKEAISSPFQEDEDINAGRSLW